MIGNISKSKGFKGDKGEPFKYDDFTPEQLKSLKGEIGNTPSIKFKYDENTGELSYTSDGILLDKEYVDSNNFATTEQLSALQEIVDRLVAKSLVKTATIDLPAKAWVEDSDNQYSQVVTVSGVTPYSKVDLQPNSEQLVVFYEKDVSFVAENDGGVITVYCIGQKPVNDYSIQATITEVEIDE